MTDKEEYLDSVLSNVDGVRPPQKNKKKARTEGNRIKRQTVTTIKNPS